MLKVKTLIVYQVFHFQQDLYNHVQIGVVQPIHNIIRVSQNQETIEQVQLVVQDLHVLDKFAAANLQLLVMLLQLILHVMAITVNVKLLAILIQCVLLEFHIVPIQYAILEWIPTRLAHHLIAIIPIIMDLIHL